MSSIATLAVFLSGALIGSALTVWLAPKAARAWDRYRPSSTAPIPDLDPYAATHTEAELEALAREFKPATLPPVPVASPEDEFTWADIAWAAPEEAAEFNTEAPEVDAATMADPLPQDAPDPLEFTVYGGPEVPTLWHGPEDADAAARIADEFKPTPEDAPPVSGAPYATATPQDAATPNPAYWEAMGALEAAPVPDTASVRRTLADELRRMRDADTRPPDAT